MPAGPLREPEERLDEVDAVVRLVSGAVPHETQGDGRSTFVTHQPLAWRNVRDPHRSDDGTRFRGPGVHAVAGIGNPQRFFAMLRAQGITPAEHPFADHHAFTRKDLDYPGATAILMTQKDAVKCASFADERFWYLPIRAVVDPRSSPSWSRRSVDPKLLELLVCPVTKGPLVYDRDKQELVSKSARLAYPVRDGIPVMLEEEARRLAPEEYE